MAALVTARPAEWVKNAFVLAPLVFAGRLDEPDAVVRTVLAFVSFCAVASAGYFVNDLRDAELDRQHPHKRNRPAARGELPIKPGLALAVLLAGAGVLAGFVADPMVAVLLLAYVGLTVSYSVVLKNLVIIDVMAIATGFVLRVEAGVAAVDAEQSEWLVMCTAMLAMLLGFTKRRQEAVSELYDGLRARPVLVHYSLPFLDQMVSLAAVGTVITYALSAVNSPNVGDRMLPTAIPVVYGVFRYLYLIFHRRDHRSTATLLASDPGIIAAGVVWIVLAASLVQGQSG